MKRYAIWDKVSPVITPSGEVFTAEQWMERYPVARLDSVTILCSPGEVNGGFFGTLGQMVSIYEEQGCDFSDCETPEEKLNRLEEFENEQEAKARAEAAAAALVPSTEERIAAALEAQVMMSMPDEEI